MRRYLTGLAFALAALALTAVLRDRLQTSMFLLFFPAILGSAYVAGLGPALMTTVIGVFATDFLLIAPIGRLGASAVEDFIRLVVFFLIAWGMSSVTASMRAATLVAERRAREAERESRLRRELIAVVGHDLRNPLNSIAAWSELLRDAELSDAQREQGLATLIGVSKQMNALVSGLLDLSQIESGRLTVTPGPVGAAGLLDEAAASLRPLASQKGVTLEVEASPDLPPMSADRTRILQVLQNIVGNAVRYSPEDAVVRLSARIDKDAMLLSVRDRGPGIPEEHLEAIFERYWRGERGSDTGAGLGLAIARAIVDAHDGRIWAESTLGHGSTFHLSLPLHCGDEPAPDAEDASSRVRQPGQLAG